MDDVVFAWAIGKALLIVFVALSILVCLAWVGAKSMLRSSERQPLENKKSNLVMPRAS